MVFRTDLRRGFPVNDIMQSPVSVLVAGVSPSQATVDRSSCHPGPSVASGPSVALSGIPLPSKRAGGHRQGILGGRGLRAT
ncbi:hypothetical protein MPC4_980001 [Methylocella tundrae]|uniref:Uncharacterized protein n=1 Tax=Methylocella tundrae TaxID=227605 RepID=A0A8B6MCC7_METTU|nr:hypothetical protein MPC4_980001 [Methylocella tundrae]